MASKVTPGILRQVEKKREVERQRLAELKLVAEKQQEAIAKVGTFSISKQVGEKGAIFGTVTNGEVADVIKEVTGQEIDRREITVPDVDQLGTYEVEIRLHPEITIAVNIEVVAK
jgi:large subunit ribosomal protein L9